MDTERKNKARSLLCPLLLLVLMGGVVCAVLLDPGDGLGLFASGLEERASYRYLREKASVLSQSDGQGRIRRGLIDPAGRPGYQQARVNVASAMTTDYRVLDTLVVLLALLTASAGIALGRPRRKRRVKSQADPLVRGAAPVIILLWMVMGLLFLFRGQLGPGGGFTGGAVLACVFMLRYLAFGQKPLARGFSFLVSLAGWGLIALGLGGLFISGSLFAVLPLAPPLGTVLSGSSAMILSIVVGLRVAGELRAVWMEFLGE